MPVIETSKDNRPQHGCSLRKILLTSAVLLTASAIADDHRPSPGEYEVTTTSNFSNQPITMTTTNCVTAEDLDQDPSKIFADTAAAENCQLATFDMADGNLNLHMVCNSDDGGMEMTTEGAYTDSGYSMTSTIVINAGGTSMTTEATVVGTRIGDC